MSSLLQVISVGLLCLAGVANLVAFILMFVYRDNNKYEVYVDGVKSTPIRFNRVSKRQETLDRVMKVEEGL